MSSNREIFKKYQREVNLGKSRDVKLMDRQMISKFVKYVKKPFDKITKEDLVSFFNDMESGNLKNKWGRPYGKYTIELCKSQAKKFFKWYTGEKEPEIVSWIQINVKKAYKKKTSADILSPEEIGILIKTANNPRNKAIVAVLYDSATRVSEFTNILLGEIIQRGNQISIVVDGKTGQREIPLNMSVPYLKTYLETHPYKDDKGKPLWINQYGRQLKITGVYYLVHGLGKESKIQKKVSPHLLRHSRLTDLANKGMTETQMKIFAGWTDTSTTPAKYLHLTNDNVRRKIYELDSRVDPIEEEVERRVESRLQELKDELFAKLKAYIDTTETIKMDYKDIAPK